MERIVYSTKEAASMLGISIPKFYDLLKRPDGPPFLKDGRVIRIPKDGFMKWLERTSNKHS